MRREAPRSPWGAVRSALRSMAGPTRPLPPSRNLSRCPACGRDRIAVVERSQQGRGLGLLLLRCAECELARHVVVTPTEAQALDALHIAHRDEIDRALGSLLRDRSLTVPLRTEEWR